jgi:hypothetical protein
MHSAATRQSTVFTNSIVLLPKDSRLPFPLLVELQSVLVSDCNIIMPDEVVFEIASGGAGMALPLFQVLKNFRRLFVLCVLSQRRPPL